jgi:3-oxoacyl-[acyl-carrier protein] reductase
VSLENRVAVITGGAKGLGKNISVEFLREGCRVLCAARDEESVSALRTLGGENVAFHKTDVRDPDSAAEAMAAAVERFGRLDILVANAGISHPGFAANADARQWADVLETNVLGTFHCVQAAIPHLKRSGDGRVITLSSALATRVAPGSSAYSVSKAAIETFTRICAIEVAGDGITVNCLAPGFIDAGMGRELAANEAIWPRYRDRLAMGRLGDAAEVARAAVFLAGADSSYVNGHVLEVNGGLNW